jgi:hypothetical protein
MKLIIYYSNNTLYSFVKAVNIVHEELIKKYPEIDFEFIDNSEMDKIYQPPGQYSPGNKHGHFFMIIENPENKKYIIVSYWDYLKDVFSTNWDIENCVEILTSAGICHCDCFSTSYNFTYTPISYTSFRPDFDERVAEVRKQEIIRTIPEKLPFRGRVYLFREYLSRDSRFNVLDMEFHHKPDSEYIHELLSNWVNLSLNGAGEICNRDIEIMGTGTALFRPKLNVKFHNELIPDHHYISVDTEDLDKSTCDIFYKQLSDRMYEKYNDVKKDLDYIKFVAKNGHDWYKENGTEYKNASIILEKIDLKKLYN